MSQNVKGTQVFKILLVDLFLSVLANLYLQWCQNNYSFSLVYLFSFNWHVEKFWLSNLVLFLVLVACISWIGNRAKARVFFMWMILLVGLANVYKMKGRMEPLYPEDFYYLKELTFLKDLLPTPLFIILLVSLLAMFLLVLVGVITSFSLPWRKQLLRVMCLILSSVSLCYVSHFNYPHNQLKQAYDRTAKWVPYSQKMNYYNVGFVAGFLYNLEVIPMEQPKNYSEKTIHQIVNKYQKSEKDTPAITDKPNIILVLSESFSNPNRLKGITVSPDPLKDYWQIGKDSVYQGSMLSENYGGGTANIEFEALTGFNMSLFNAQLTTPYTMLLPKQTRFPSFVSDMKNLGYTSIAIHPYNTSMYKRREVYTRLGFDEFLEESSFSTVEKLGNNPYVPDQAVFSKTLDMLKEDPSVPKLFHLVTMQSHLPYQNKYLQSDYQTQPVNKKLENYSQDLAYSSQAVAQFIEELNKLKQPSIVVYYGDHLPSLYPEEIRKQHKSDKLHETEFFIWSSKEAKAYPDYQTTVLSPQYFTLLTKELANLPLTGFDRLRQALLSYLPAFERGRYYYEGKYHKELSLNNKQQQIYQDYQLIQYDITVGEQYSLKQGFFGGKKE